MLVRTSVSLKEILERDRDFVVAVLEVDVATVAVCCRGFAEGSR